MSNKNKINIENRIMDKVMSGEVKMKPKWYFVLGSMLSIAGLVGLAVGAIFLTNLTLFLIRKQGPGIGKLNMMLESFPLWIPLLAVLFIILGIWLLKKYDFSYKKNLLLLVIVLVVAVVISALVIDLLGLNDIWSKKGPMKGFYISNQSREVRGASHINPRRRINN